jgi:lipoate---protein ligase
VWGSWWVEERTGDAASLHAAWPEVSARAGRRAVAVCQVTGPALVLGSTQSADVVDRSRAAAAGTPVARRRSGGGVVLVGPEDPAWVDVWIPAGDPLWRDDVGRAFDWMGDTWVAALGSLGIAGVSAHRGGYVACTRWATSVCFGGVGTGEVVTDDGRKVVGLAQRRNRDGAWFHGACYLWWNPAPLVGLLAMSASEREAAAIGLRAAAVGVAELGARAGGDPVTGGDVASSVVAALP